MRGFDTCWLQINDLEARRFEVVCQLRIEQMMAHVGFWIGRGLLETALVNGVRDGAVEEKAQSFLNRGVVVDVDVERPSRSQDTEELLYGSHRMVEAM